MNYVATAFEQWYTAIRKQIFTYRDDYYELPYLATSPAVMVESLQQMPFTRTDKKDQSIHSTTPFIEGCMRYRELEPGLWIIVTEMHFRENICTKAFYNNKPADYYFIAHSLYTHQIQSQQQKKHPLLLPSRSWSLYRPGAEITNYHVKGTRGLYMYIAFSETWLEHSLKKMQVVSRQTTTFLESHNRFISWKDLVPHGEHITTKIWERLCSSGIARDPNIHVLVLEVISGFFKALEQLPAEIPATLNRKDYRAVAKAELILVNNLTREFPGIELIAQTLRISPTKLKSSFKIQFGTSLYQYYREKQLILAQELLQKMQHLPIKEIARIIGYENHSKFTAAYKKKFGKLPSERH